MPAPLGVKANRWNQAVNRIATDTGMATAEADLWLTNVWTTMFLGDEVADNIVAHDKLRRWLESNGGPGTTLPMAFRLWATA